MLDVIALLFESVIWIVSKTKDIGHAEQVSVTDANGVSAV